MVSPGASFASFLEFQLVQREMLVAQVRARKEALRKSLGDEPTDSIGKVWASTAQRAAISLWHRLM